MKKILFLLLALLGTAGAWADPISDVSQLSNTKVYSVVTERGAWKAESANMGYDANITDAADVPNNDSYKFAILKQGDYFFLYSVSAGKFICPQKYYTEIMPTPLSIENLSGGQLKMTSSNPSKAINIGGGQWTWDGWTTTDGGNRLTITEVGDIDPTTALAMLSTQVFTVSCQRGSWAVTSDHTALTAHNASNVDSSNEADHQFALFTCDGKMYLYSVGAEKFVKSDGSLFDGKSDPITFQATNDATWPYHFYFALPEQIYFNLQDGAGSIIFNSWSGQDGGSKYQIASVASADVAAITAKATEVFHGTQTITYTIKINGNTVATETREQKVGQAASLSSTYTDKEYVTYSYSPTTIAVGTTDVEVTATVGTLPFEVSTDFDNAHWYNIKIGANQRYVGWEDSEPYHTHADDEATEFVRAHDTYQWAFMGNPVSGIKVVNRHTGASMSLTSEGTGTNVNGATGIPNTVLRSGDHYWDIHENGTGFSLNLIGKSNYYINTHGGPNGYFQIWQAGGARTDGGSRMTVAEVPDLSTTITYNVSYNGSVVYTTSVPGVIGDAVGDLPSDVTRDFVTIIGHDATATITRDMTVALTATWDSNAPFELADSYTNAHWYDMSIRDTWYVTSDNVDGDGALKTVNANAMGLAEDAYQWAFVGDPWHIQLFNKDKGSSEVYAWTSTDNSSIPAFVSASSTNYWWIRRSTNSGAAYTNAFLLTIPGYGYQVNQFGGAGGTLKIWTSTGTGDEGSAFKVFDVPDDFAEFAVAEVQPSATATGYFAFNNTVKATIGWQDSYATHCPFETYKSMKLALEAIDMTDMSNFVLPETGYYLLKNKFYGTYMGIDPSDANMYGNYATATAAKQIVKLTKNSDNTYTIGLMGKYAPATVSRSAQVTAEPTASTYTVVIPTVGYAAFQAAPSVQYSALHCASGGSIVGWETPADASQWEAIDATSINFEIGTGGDGYATAYLPFPYTTPEGVTAYTGTLNGSSVSLTAIEGTVPANTAVVLKGTAGTNTFNIADEADAIADNALSGSYDPVTGGEGIFALAKKNNVVGFYPVASTVTIPVGKAYLNTNSDVKRFTFSFEDDATGIEVIDNSTLTNDHPIYNVAGQRIQKMQKGINIVNGRKVLF